MSFVFFIWIMYLITKIMGFDNFILVSDYLLYVAWGFVFFIILFPRTFAKIFKLQLKR